MLKRIMVGENQKEALDKLIEARAGGVYLLLGRTVSEVLAVAQVKARSFLCLGIKKAGARGACGRCEICVGRPEVLLAQKFLKLEPKLGIDDIREFRVFLRLKPTASRRRAVILRLTQATPEAQNALLKVLEEPPQETLIILGAGPGEFILPTLNSRATIFLIDDPASLKGGVEVGQLALKQILALTPLERLTRLSGATKTMDKAEAQLVFSHWLAACLKKAQAGVAENQVFLKAAEFARGALVKTTNDDAAPWKLFIEQFSLHLP